MKSYEVHTKDNKVIMVECGGHYIDHDEKMFCLGTYDDDTDIVYDQVGVPLANLSYYKILHAYDPSEATEEVLH